MKKIIMLMLFVMCFLFGCGYNNLNVDSGMLILDLTDYPDIVGEKLILEAVPVYQQDGDVIGEYVLQTKTNIYWTIEDYLPIAYNNKTEIFTFVLNISFKNSDEIVYNKQTLTMDLPGPKNADGLCYIKKEISIPYDDRAIPAILVLNYYGVTFF